MSGPASVAGSNVQAAAGAQSTFAAISSRSGSEKKKKAAEQLSSVLDSAEVSHCQLAKCSCRGVNVCATFLYVS